MANKNLRLTPHSVGKNCWWYELPQGIEVHISGCEIHRCEINHSVVISWKALKVALQIKEK